MYDNEIYSGTGNNASGADAQTRSDSLSGTENAEQTQRYYDYTAYQSASGVFAANNTAASNNKTKVKKEKREKKSGFFYKAVATVSLGLFFGLCAGIGFYAVVQGTGMMRQEREETRSEVISNNVDSVKTDKTQSGIKLTNTENIKVVTSDVSDVVEEVMPAMVSIINNYTTTNSFWGQTFTEDKAASGSGIIVAENDEELLVVTNYHVAASATKLELTFIDGSMAEAKVKGMDADMDLAVLAVALSDLSDGTKNAISVATLGNSDSLKLGEPVIAIGNALGYGQSVTGGYVSALNREVTMSDGSTGIFIQTDAAINPGNSGGALLNIKGEVIGINSNKIGGTAIEGMGYAIPISSASPIISDMLENKTRKTEVERGRAGYLGVSLQEVPAQVTQTYHMPSGVFVYSVEEGGAAEAAGIMPSDIITRLEGEKIESYNDLQNVMKYYAVGDEIKVTVMRPGNGGYEEHEFKATLGARPVE